MSAIQYELLGRYDSYSCLRKEKKNRYFTFSLFFYRDYFVRKLINKLMHDGERRKALLTAKAALWSLKKIFGFQPFFFFKHVAFRMRQLFKVDKTVIRQKVTYAPRTLRAHNQVTYGINHLVQSARLLSADERTHIAAAMGVVPANSFVCAIGAAE
jgi:ribosomal protein S7